jgi:hypothetical protein
MPIPGEHKTVQARILAYAEAIGWTFVSREEAEQRRGMVNGQKPEVRSRKSEAGSRKPEVGSQNASGGIPMFLRTHEANPHHA